ncbi:hypothetical protein QCA50_001614 [Cerrena zonata]|uniref:NAD-dependent epimerase/dehydratase domain-containing protein n=1 Tax=Cerrena zonata TaxID=2478898 RepID=A0AAW0GVB5_9APHY
MTGKSALVLGATGATGKFLLQELLNSPAYSRVGEYGRRVTTPETITTGKYKLEQKAIDFEKLGESGLKDGKWDVVFITLGTRRANVSSAAEFEKIDREYVVNAAREAKTDDPSVDQRLIYVSSAGANKNSWFLYPKSKGLTEDELSKLGYKETLIFRPGALTEGKRGDHRLAESILINTLNLRTSWTNDYTIECPILGRALKNAGALSLLALEKFSAKDAGFPFTLFNNPPLRALAEESV